MDKLLEPGKAIGRYCVAIAMVAFGTQHLIYADFVTRVAPKLPAWAPGHSLIAYGFGLYLIAAGIANFVRKSARSAALLLGATILASFALLYLPLIIGNPGNAGLWVNAGKALALSGGAFLVAGSLPAMGDGFQLKRGPVINLLEKFIPLGPYLIGAFFAYCGVLHFFYVKLVAGLVPWWIPGHVFWTFFSGAALIAGGVGMSIRPTARLAAALSAVMIFLWVVMLHIPRALANVRDSNETTAVFEALAIAGAALLAATSQPRKAFEDFVELRTSVGGAPLVICGNHELTGLQKTQAAAANDDQEYA